MIVRRVRKIILVRKSRLFSLLIEKARMIVRRVRKIILARKSRLFSLL